MNFLSRLLSPFGGALSRSSHWQTNDRTPSYTSNVTTPPTHSLPGRDSVRHPNKTESSLTETLGEAETSEVKYIYYRIYAEDGAIPSKAPVDPGEPFLGRIIAKYVLPPRNVKAVKRSIENVENIKYCERTSLFLTPYSESPMDDDDMFTIHNHGTVNDPGSKPQEPLAFVSKMSDSERTTLESDGRGGLASTAKPPPDIQHVYYVLYANGYGMPSKVAFDPEEPFLGRIRADSVAPPHNLTSFKLCLSRVEKNPTLAYAANFFENISCETPLKKGHISLRTDGPGLGPNKPLAIVLTPPIPGPDGRYIIKNRAADIYWGVDQYPIKEVYFYTTTMEDARKNESYQWDIKHDTDGNSISITSGSPAASGANLTASGSTARVPVPWRLIPADGKSYYLTTEMNLDSQYLRVLAAQGEGYGIMASLKKGKQKQMWEFIPV